jgi:hypothetical protein
MAIIRAIPLSSTPVKVIPPDNAEHTGAINWTLSSTAAAVLLDAPSGGNAFPLAAGAAFSSPATTDEELWATGTGTMNVLGLATSDD